MGEIKISLFHDWRKSVVESSKIELLKAEGRYSLLSIKKEEVFSDKSISEWEQELGELNFFRVHKSYLVNLKYIDQIGDMLVLKNGVKIPLARRRKKEFEEKYKEYIIR